MDKNQSVLVTLEPKDTPMGEFQKERTDAISEMFDNADRNGIYPTSKFFARLDNCVRKLLKELGYREGKPPLLNDYNLYFRGFNLHIPDVIKEHIFDDIIKAQRDSDIKWYRGK